PSARPRRPKAGGSSPGTTRGLRPRRAGRGPAPTKAARAGSSAKSRVQAVAPPGAHDAPPERGQHDRGPREDRDPPRRLDVLAAIAHHVAEAGERRLHAEAEEREPGLEDDVLREIERDVDDQRAGDVRQDMAQIDAPRRSPELLDRDRVAVL